ncbi:MAG: hypothetical protein JXR19_03565 [Bacteroidia bacterium]
MCFSATASFASSAVLITVGVVSMKKAKGTAYRPIAGIACLFGLQQFTEGFVWLGLQHDSFASLLNMSALGFLIFAWIVWPMYIPYAMMHPEKIGKRKQWMKVFLGTGLVVTLALVYILTTKGFTPEIRGHSIHYNVAFKSFLTGPFSILYLMCAIVPPFISSGRMVWLLGGTTLCSFLIARFFYLEHLLSVWCFFAALGSAFVLLAVHLNTKKDNSLS